MVEEILLSALIKGESELAGLFFSLSLQKWTSSKKNVNTNFLSILVRLDEGSKAGLSTTKPLRHKPERINKRKTALVLIDFCNFLNDIKLPNCFESLNGRHGYNFWSRKLVYY